jgi:hypothetical protein
MGGVTTVGVASFLKIRRLPSLIELTGELIELTGELIE